jgi:hypothetical protein
MSEQVEITKDREIYLHTKGCTMKAFYPTFDDAQQKGQYVYVCNQCGYFHRTSLPLDAISERQLVYRLYGSVSPRNITAYLERIGRL